MQGVGASAISLPPMDTTNTSSGRILSRINSSCGRSLLVLSFSVVASTAAERVSERNTQEYSQQVATAL